MRIDRVASKKLQRQRPLDGNTKHAVFSRGKPTYPMGSPNPTGVNQHKGVKPMANRPPPSPTFPVGNKPVAVGAKMRTPMTKVVSAPPLPTMSKAVPPGAAAPGKVRREMAGERKRRLADAAGKKLVMQKQQIMRRGK